MKMTREQYTLLGPAGLMRECERVEDELASVRSALDDCDLHAHGSLVDRVRALTYHHRQWKEMYADAANRAASSSAYAEARLAVLKRLVDVVRRAQGGDVSGTEYYNALDAAKKVIAAAETTRTEIGTVIGVDKGSPDGDCTVKGYRDAEGRVHVTSIERSPAVGNPQPQAAKGGCGKHQWMLCDHPECDRACRLVPSQGTAEDDGRHLLERMTAHLRMVRDGGGTEWCKESTDFVIESAESFLAQGDGNG